MARDSSGGLRARLRRPLPERTSEVLREIAAAEGERGVPTVCGVALVIIALNLVAARQRLWLPAAIADKSIARADLKRVVDRAAPYLERLERVCKPRLAIVTEPVGKVLIGLVILVLGFIMILPIPFIGNLPPGWAATFIAIGMTERDGLVVLIGIVVSAAAVALASVGTWTAVLAIVDYF
jgi:hypothetical protein